MAPAWRSGVCGRGFSRDAAAYWSPLKRLPQSAATAVLGCNPENSLSHLPGFHPGYWRLRQTSDSRLSVKALAPCSAELKLWRMKANSSCDVAFACSCPNVIQLNKARLCSNRRNISMSFEECPCVSPFRHMSRGLVEENIRKWKKRETLSGVSKI